MRYKLLVFNYNIMNVRISIFEPADFYTRLPCYLDFTLALIQGSQGGTEFPQFLHHPT